MGELYGEILNEFHGSAADAITQSGYGVFSNISALDGNHCVDFKVSYPNQPKAIMFVELGDSTKDDEFNHTMLNKRRKRRYPQGRDTNHILSHRVSQHKWLRDPQGKTETLRDHSEESDQVMSFPGIKPQPNVQFRRSG